MEAYFNIVKPTMFLNPHKTDNAVISFDITYDGNRLTNFINEKTCQVRIVEKDSVDRFWLPKEFSVVPVKVIEIAGYAEELDGSFSITYYFSATDSEVMKLGDIKLKVKFDSSEDILHFNRQTNFDVESLFDLIIKR